MTKSPQSAETIEATKQALRDQYDRHLEEIFASDTFQMTFDQREQLIYGKFEKEACAILERHLKEDPQSIIHNQEPVPSVHCHCGAEAQLIKEDDGAPKKHKRRVATKNGSVTTEEYGYHCPIERKIFFPSAQDA